MGMNGMLSKLYPLLDLVWWRFEGLYYEAVM